MKRVFADTSYLIAVVAPDDAMHRRAMELAAKPMHVTVTAWVMAELAAYLGNPPNRTLFIKILATMRQDPQVEFVPATQDLFDEGVELYRDRPDKRWSLVDCISFIVMQQRGLSEALTADHHFKQAGFNALLLQDEG